MSGFQRDIDGPPPWVLELACLLGPPHAEALSAGADGLDWDQRDAVCQALATQRGVPEATLYLDDYGSAGVAVVIVDVLGDQAGVTLVAMAATILAGGAYPEEWHRKRRLAATQCRLGLLYRAAQARSPKGPP